MSKEGIDNGETLKRMKIEKKEDYGIPVTSSERIDEMIEEP